MKRLNSVLIENYKEGFKLYIEGELTFVCGKKSDLSRSIETLKKELGLVEFSATEPNNNGPKPTIMLTVQRVGDDVEINPLWDVHVDAQPAGLLPYWRWKKAVGELFGPADEPTQHNQKERDITIALTADEALVLYDNLAKLNQSTVVKGLKESAIQRISNEIEARLEPYVDSIFAPDYDLRLKEAEKRLTK